MRRLVLALVAALVVVAALVAIKAATDEPASHARPGDASTGHVHALIAFVGDSNLVFGMSQLDEALDLGLSGYVTVDASATGATIRWNGCYFISGVPCPDVAYPDYWKVKVGELRKRSEPDVYVVDLGINDALNPGRETSPGYGHYGAKIDWMMRLLPAAKPVLWTNLPCAVEPADTRTGCASINAELAAARARWKNLTVLDWAAKADAHPEYMQHPKIATVHYTSAGYDAYAALVADAIKSKAP